MKRLPVTIADSWGYSPLNQINRTNVAQLRLAWTRGLGPGNTQEATPLIYAGMMYIPNPGDYIQALDARTGVRRQDRQSACPITWGRLECRKVSWP
jgi:glucose dehydrogenase